MGKWFFRLLLLVVTVGCIFALKVWMFNPEPVPVKVVRAEIGRVEETVTNSRAGTVKARRRAHLSTEVGGRVVAISHQTGALVKKGDILIQLNDAAEQAKLGLAQRELVVAKARRDQACLAAERANREYTRFRDLSKKELVSIDELDKVNSTARTTAAACKATQAGVDRAHAAIQESRAELNKMVLRAPFSGILGAVEVEVGEWTTPAPPGVPIPPVLDLIDPNSIYVSAPMDEVDSAKIHPLQLTRVTLDPYPGRSFRGQVVRVAPYVEVKEEQNRTVEIEVELDDQEFASTLLPGTSADVEVILSSRDEVLRIPTSTLLEGNRVWVADEGQLGERAVRIGLKNWDYVEVTHGLIAGEPIIASLDGAGIKEGDPVMVQENSIP